MAGFGWWRDSGAGMLVHHGEVCHVKYSPAERGEKLFGGGDLRRTASILERRPASVRTIGE